MSHAPLTSYIWKNVHNVIPIIFVEYRDKHNSKTSLHQFTLIETFTKLITDAGGIVIPLKLEKNDNTVLHTQLSRLTAAFLPFVHPTDMIITTDTDLWPLDRDFWTAFGSFYRGFVVYNGKYWDNVYSSPGGLSAPDFIAISAVAAQAYKWHTLLYPFVDLTVCSDILYPNRWKNGYEYIKTTDIPLSHIYDVNDPSLKCYRRILSRLVSTSFAYEPAWQRLPADYHVRGSGPWTWDQLLLSSIIRGLFACHPGCVTDGFPLPLEDDKLDKDAPEGCILGWCVTNRRFERLDRPKWNDKIGGDDVWAYTDAHLPQALPFTQYGWSLLSNLWHGVTSNSSFAKMYQEQACQLKETVDFTKEFPADQVTFPFAGC